MGEEAVVKGRTEEVVAVCQPDAQEVNGVRYQGVCVEACLADRCEVGEGGPEWGGC